MALHDHEETVKDKKQRLDFLHQDCFTIVYDCLPSRSKLAQLIEKTSSIRKSRTSNRNRSCELTHHEKPLAPMTLAHLVRFRE